MFQTIQTAKSTAWMIRKEMLPLNSAKVKTIAVMGGHADVGMISGGGSAQVDPPGGNAILPPGKGATHWQEHIWFPTSPLKALREKMPNAKVEFNSGEDVAAAAAAAKSADVAIVFAYQWESEGVDLATLALPDNQDALIEAVAAANPRTIVVLETGTAVTMPWLGKVSGVVEAWYAGSAGHTALANVLTGEVNATGKLAMTFPKSDSDLPHPAIPALSKEDEGAGSGAVDDRAHMQSKYSVAYDEGLKVGYKWYEAEHKEPLFPFGFGLSYTTYSYSGLKVEAAAKTVTFAVKNTGKRAGVEIAEVYAMTPAADEPFKRLVGWQRVELGPGETKMVTVDVDPRVMSVFSESTNAWSLLPGTYKIEAGSSSAETPLSGAMILP